MKRICEKCMYMGCCEFERMDANCRVADILDCKEIARKPWFRSIEDDIRCIPSTIEQNHVEKELFELLSWIRYNANLEVPKWFREG